jgi:DNA-binding PadR family transcriptional regulator
VAVSAHAPVGVQIEEAATVMVPAPGVSIYQALRDAELDGFLSITVHDDNTATIVWYQGDR